MVMAFQRWMRWEWCWTRWKLFWGRYRTDKLWKHELWKRELWKHELWKRELWKCELRWHLNHSSLAARPWEWDLKLTSQRGAKLKNRFKKISWVMGMGSLSVPLLLCQLAWLVPQFILHFPVLHNWLSMSVFSANRLFYQIRTGRARRLNPWRLSFVVSLFAWFACCQLFVFFLLGQQSHDLLSRAKPVETNCFIFFATMTETSVPNMKKSTPLFPSINVAVPFC